MKARLMNDVEWKADEVTFWRQTNAKETQIFFPQIVFASTLDILIKQLFCAIKLYSITNSIPVHTQKALCVSHWRLHETGNAQSYGARLLQREETRLSTTATEGRLQQGTRWNRWKKGLERNIGLR